MMIIRILLLGFSAAVFTFLIYRLLQIYRSAHPQRSMQLTIGIILLLLPSIVIVGFIKPTWHYLLFYPVAISLFLYLVRSKE
jgi:hypothetical protein